MKPCLHRIPNRLQYIQFHVRFVYPYNYRLGHIENYLYLQMVKRTAGIAITPLVNPSIEYEAFEVPVTVDEL